MTARDALLLSALRAATSLREGGFALCEQKENSFQRSIRT